MRGRNYRAPVGTWASDKRPLRTAGPGGGGLAGSSGEGEGASPSRAWPSQTNGPNCLGRGRADPDWRRRRLEGDASGQEEAFFSSRRGGGSLRRPLGRGRWWSENSVP